MQMLLLSALHAVSLEGLPSTIAAQHASIAEAKTMIVLGDDGQGDTAGANSADR
ncbi:hypothetical protein G6020_03920 [Dietzia sp. B19]|uniref:hypothetical protein n=1 Tax=Dietzia sp. B19 TaxID=1630632 RepID=UPI0015FCAB45|nr:hypothetical protein [Dietzia sp. B19]MBB1056558.1 hypothetical protein [Dietzia sp. B19]